MVECLTVNQVVQGSNPCSDANIREIAKRITATVLKTVASDRTGVRIPLSRPIIWGVGLVWSRLAALGAVDDGSNPSFPTIHLNTMTVIYYLLGTHTATTHLSLVESVES